MHRLGDNPPMSDLAEATRPQPSVTPTTQSCDVLVIGGGPAGSTIAALLAGQGRSVVLTEKAQHPRFHIGESLLPANVPLLERLGLREAVEAIGMPKWGVEFVSHEHGRSVHVDFTEAWDKSMPLTWQVRRSEFDELLFRHAGRQGAATVEGCQVRDVGFDADGADVRARLDDGSERHWRARFVVDASGRDTFLAHKFASKQRNRRHNSSALYGHFTGAERLPGKREGNISVFWFEHGWFWFIPLSDGTTSVGAVCWPPYLKSRRKPMREFFADTLALCPMLAERLRSATLVDDRVHATGNYSYDGTVASGERYLLLGDAFAFVDPVFSSGVYLAMHSAFEGAETVADCLDHPQRAARSRRAFDAMMKKGPAEFSWLIFRMTNPTMRDLFMNPRNVLRMKEALMSLLAGDIFGRTPSGPSLMAFKCVYYLSSLANLPRTLRAWRQRQLNIRDLGPLEGETVMERR